MDTFYDRLVKEKKELDDRIDKLEAFMRGNAALKLSSEEYALLEIQYWLMKGYSSTLSRRINLVTIKES